MSESTTRDRSESADRTRFEAYERADRPVGIRNRVLVLPSVICSHMVADRIAAEVPEAVSAPHDHGCAQLGADNEQTKQTFLGVSTNPNIAGTVVVGLGCEEIQSTEVARELDALGAPVRELSIQGIGGTDACIERGIEEVRDLVSVVGTSQRTTAGLGDLTLGIVSSDVRPSTTDTADPLVGELARAVTDAGGRVLAAGIERLTPHADAAVDAAIDAETRDAFGELLARHRDKPARMTRVRAEAAERSFEEVTRAWGGLAIEDVIDYGNRATHESGLAILDAPSQFEEAATGLAAAGAQLIVHATADGIPTGHPICPVFKVSGDEDTVDALPDDIDVDATTAAPEELIERVASVADGESCCAERHGLTEFAITRVGPSM